MRSPAAARWPNLADAGTNPPADFLRPRRAAAAVDLPGYGYASAPKTDIKAWTTLTRKFLAGRASLQRVFLLVDSRRGGTADSEIMKLLDASAVSWAVVMTKADKLKPKPLEQVCSATKAIVAACCRLSGDLRHLLAEGHGIAELRAHLAGLALPRG